MKLKIIDNFTLNSHCNIMPKIYIVYHGILDKFLSMVTLFNPFTSSLTKSLRMVFE